MASVHHAGSDLAATSCLAHVFFTLMMQAEHHFVQKVSLTPKTETGSLPGHPRCSAHISMADRGQLCTMIHLLSFPYRRGRGPPSGMRNMSPEILPAPLGTAPRRDCLCCKELPEPSHVPALGWSAPGTNQHKSGEAQPSPQVQIQAPRTAQLSAGPAATSFPLRLHHSSAPPVPNLASSSPFPGGWPQGLPRTSLARDLPLGILPRVPVGDTCLHLT